MLTAGYSQPKSFYFVIHWLTCGYNNVIERGLVGDRIYTPLIAIELLSPEKRG